jgi:elongation factor Ts
MVKVDDIKALREKTGAGIADCKEALSLSKGSIGKAVEIIKEKGLEKATKKADRETHSGLVFSYVHGGKIGVLVSLLCETDFVAKTDDFLILGKEICLQVASMNPKNIDDLLKQEYIRDSKLTIDGMIKAVIGKLGENIKISDFSRLAI